MSLDLVSIVDGKKINKLLFLACTSTLQMVFTHSDALARAENIRHRKICIVFVGGTAGRFWQQSEGAAGAELAASSGDAEMALLSVANCDTAGASKVNTWNAVPTLLLIVR